MPRRSVKVIGRSPWVEQKRVVWSGPWQLHARHGVHVDVTAGLEAEPARGALDLEAELPVERDRRIVRTEHHELEPHEVQPIVRKVDRRADERGADTAPLVAARYRDGSDASDV